MQFVYSPIKTLIECCMADNREKLWKLTDSLGVTKKLKSEDKDLVCDYLFPVVTLCIARTQPPWDMRNVPHSAACVSARRMCLRLSSTFKFATLSL